MPPNRYIRNNAGTLTETPATQVSTGASDAGEIVALDDTGRLDQSLMPTGIGADTAILPASEALAAGNLVNVWNDGGTARVRKADASAPGKEAHGFVLAGVAQGANASVYFEGNNGQVSGQTPGVVFLSATTPGATSPTAPNGSGQIVQRVGFATSPTSINFDAMQPVVLA